MKLIYESTGAEVKVGDVAKTFRGEEVVISGFREPHKASSSGRVYVKPLNGREPYAGAPPWATQEYFPGVIGARWIEI